MSTGDDRKNEESESQDSDLQKTLQELTKKTAELSQEIKDSSSRLVGESDSFKQETQNLQSAISKELEVFNNTAVAYRKQATDAARQILKAAEDYTSSTHGLLKEVEKWSYRILVISLVVTVLYVFSSTLLRLSDVTLVSVILLVVSIIASANITLRSIHGKFKDYEDKIAEDTKVTIRDVAGFIARPLELRTDPRNVNQKLSTFMSEFNKVLGAIGHYVPHLEKLYAWKNKEHRIRVFTQSVRNSLRNFGIKLDTRVDSDLLVFGPWEESEDEWLMKVSKIISKRLDIPEEAVLLAYYEYTDNVEGKRNAWNTILGKRELLKKMVEILCQGKIVDVQYLDVKQLSSVGAIEEILSRIGSFSLEEFRSVYYGFYTELTRHKRNVLSTLAEYNLKIDQATENKILGFVPKTNNREEWINELFELAARLVSVKRDIIELICSDRIGEYTRRKKCWENINHNNLLEELARFLLQQRQLELPDHYGRKPQSAKFVSRIIGEDSDYNLSRIIKTVSDALSKLDNQKKSLTQAIRSYSLHLSEDDREEFESLLPANDPLFDALTAYIQQKMMIDRNVIKLFYFDYVQAEEERKLLFSNILNLDTAAQVASLALRRMKIEIPKKKDDTVANLLTIMKSMSDFDVMKLQVLHGKYATLITYSDKILDFLRNERIVPKKEALDFVTLHEVIGEKIEASTFEQLKTLIEYIMKQNGTFSSLGTQEMRDIIVAAAALFLSQQEDAIAAEACMEAAQYSLASKVLYQCINLRDKKLGKTTVCLKNIAEAVIGEKYKDYDLLSDFKSKLAQGLLVRSLQELLLASIKKVEEEFGRTEELRMTLAEMKEELTAFFNIELHEDSVALLLNTGIISAYLITTSSGAPVFSGVIEGTLVDSCNKLATQDPSFEKLLQLETEEKVAGGRHTRVGLVPLNMHFEDFSDRFHKLFAEATASYIGLHPEDAQKDYSINLIRIFPSDVSFKLIQGTQAAEAKPLTNPVETIKNLMIEKFDLVSNLEFVVSLKGEEPKTTMKNIVTTIINTETSIYSLTKSSVGHIVSKHPKLLEKMENREFDKELESKRNCRNLSELAIIVHKIKTENITEVMEAFEKEFLVNIKQIISSTSSRLEQSQLISLSKSILATLDRIGAIFLM